MRRKAHRDYWWHYGDKRPALYSSMASLRRVLVISEVSKYAIFAFQPTTMVFSHMVVVFSLDNWSDFALLQSNIHIVWAWAYSSTMRNAGLRYSPSHCFVNFPFPDTNTTDLKLIGKDFYQYRQELVVSQQVGFTKIYNRLHDPADITQDIARLRQLNGLMDNAVAAAYGWQDLDLGHGFHETGQGIRYTISEAARREVLTRLLQLNYQRYAEEVKLGLHEKKRRSKGAGGQGRKKKPPKKKNDGQLSLF